MTALASFGANQALEAMLTLAEEMGWGDDGV